MTGDKQLPDADDRAIAYVRRLQAEVEAGAAERRRQDPSLEVLEREIARKWESIAPIGATGDHRELLLDRLELLAHIDVDAPTGTRPGIRQVKGAIRRLNYWYLRYLADQVNAVHNVVLRILRRFDDRLDQVEGSLSLDAVSEDLVDPIPDVSLTAASAIAKLAGGSSDNTRPVAVVSCGGGVIVGALAAIGSVAHGIDPDPKRLLPGVHEGLDLRSGDPTGYLNSLPSGSLGAVVLTGVVEDLALRSVLALLQAAVAAVGDQGRIVVAVMDPEDRGPVDRDLRAGRGVGPSAWAHLLGRRGWDTHLEAVEDPRVKLIVVADQP